MVVIEIVVIVLIMMAVMVGMCNAYDHDEDGGDG
jgi:hypothetical protein